MSKVRKVGKVDLFTTAAVLLTCVLSYLYLCAIGVDALVAGAYTVCAVIFAVLVGALAIVFGLGVILAWLLYSTVPHMVEKWVPSNAAAHVLLLHYTIVSTLVALHTLGRIIEKVTREET